MNAKEKRHILKLSKKLRAFAAERSLVLAGFDHIGSTYEPSPSATFRDANNDRRSVNLPFWVIERLGFQLQ